MRATKLKAAKMMDAKAKVITNAYTVLVQSVVSSSNSHTTKVDMSEQEEANNKAAPSTCWASVNEFFNVVSLRVSY